MPLSGQGMLITIMDVDPALEQDFNRWYDKEHLADRVVLPGFLEARRYIAVDASPRYLNYYTTTSFDVLLGADYLQARRNHTPWGLRHVPHFCNSTRVIAKVTASRGQGRGGFNSVARIRPAVAAAGHAALRDHLLAQSESILDRDEVISLHLLEAGSETGQFTPEAHAKGEADWYWIIEGTSAQALRNVPMNITAAGAQQISSGIYRLMWDLAKPELIPRSA
jgi:hypothetical protein